MIRERVVLVEHFLEQRNRALRFGLLHGADRQELELVVVDDVLRLEAAGVGLERLRVVQVATLRKFLAQRGDGREGVFRLAEPELRERLVVVRGVSASGLLRDHAVEPDDGLVVLPLVEMTLTAAVVRVAAALLAERHRERPILEREVLVEVEHRFGHREPHLTHVIGRGALGFARGSRAGFFLNRPGVDLLRLTGGHHCLANGLLVDVDRRHDRPRGADRRRGWWRGRRDGRGRRHRGSRRRRRRRLCGRGQRPSDDRYEQNQTFHKLPSCVVMISC